MPRHSENRLKDSASPYLRSAAHQPIDWYEWGDAAFERAKADDKPMLLDIGAVWCHWCHVIDRESYENPDIAKIISDNFIAVKVDRDERPDVDSRYQSAISSISGQGGWPLTGFLLPDGRPFFGGTYFPPEDQMGRPGFRRVLLAVAESYRSKRAELERAASSLAEAVALLAKHKDDARLLAGGQSLIATLNMRLSAPDLLIDINGIKGLDGIAKKGKFVEIGALARHVQVDIALSNAMGLGGHHGCVLFGRIAECDRHT